MGLKTTSIREVHDHNPRAQDITNIHRKVRVKVEIETAKHTPHPHTKDQEKDGDVIFVTVGIIPSGNVL